LAIYDRLRRADDLPPPQVVLSNVIPIGLERGATVLGAYDDGGASTPIVVAVMRTEIHIQFDHRVYNPPDEQSFAESFSRLLGDNLSSSEPRLTAQRPSSAN
jgi:hypothetical protein